MEEIFSRIVSLPQSLQYGTESPSFFHLEESTIYPQHHLPSFVEVCHFVQDTMISLQDTLLLGIDSLNISLAAYTDRMKGLIQKLLRIVSRSIQRYNLEVLALIVFKLELESLRRFDASMSEAMFGLKRVRTKQRKTPSINHQVQLLPMTEFDRVKSAFFIALLCYLRHSLSKVWLKLKGRRNENSTFDVEISSAFPPEALKKLFITLFPFLHMTTEGTHLIFQWRYLFGKSIHASLALRMLGLVVRRVALSDNINSTMNNGKDQSSSNENIVARTLVAPSIYSGLGLLYLVNLVLDYYRKIKYYRRRVLLAHYDTSNLVQRNTRSTAINIELLIPPPKQLSPKDNMLLDFRVCPVCKSNRIIPTVCSHGYVYCYRCISNHLRDNNELCPVTNERCCHAQIIRLREV